MMLGSKHPLEFNTILDILKGPIPDASHPIVLDFSYMNYSMCQPASAAYLKLSTQPEALNHPQYEYRTDFKPSSDSSNHNTLSSSSSCSISTSSSAKCSDIITSSDKLNENDNKLATFDYGHYENRTDQDIKYANPTGSLTAQDVDKWASMSFSNEFFYNCITQADDLSPSIEFDHYPIQIEDKFYE